MNNKDYWFFIEKYAAWLKMPDNLNIDTIKTVSQKYMS